MRLFIKLGDLKRILREELNQVDTDPSNNPGRPDDPYDYIGMHPPANAAMAHSAASGGVASPADIGGSSSGGTSSEDSPADDSSSLKI
jgi:hypothetical protein